MKKKITIKNYIYLVILFLVTIVLTFTLRNVYLSNSDTNKFLPEVSIDEFRNYVQENPNIIIYLSYSSDNKKLEKKLEKYLIKNDIKNGIVYISLDNMSNDTLNILNNEYLASDYENGKIEKCNNILIVKDGKIINVLYNAETEMVYDEVIDFLEKNEVFE